MTKAIFPACYFGSISYWAGIVQYDKIVLEKKEYFVKQSIRNRTDIVGATGKLCLSVPTARKGRDKNIVDEVEIVYDENWQVNHWRSLCTAYRSSPYFEYYESEFEQLFLQRYKTIFELNLATFDFVKKQLQIESEISFTETFQVNYDFDDFRPFYERKAVELYRYPRYIQVFEERAGFVENTSILDLLFNEGPAGLSYLKSIQKIAER